MIYGIKLYTYNLFRCCRDILAHIVCTNRQLTMAAIDEDSELDGLRTAHVDDGIKRRTDRTSRIKHIIRKYNGLAGDVYRHLRRMHDWLIRECREIIPIKCDIQNANRRLFAFDLFNLICNALGNRYTAGTDSYSNDIFHALVFLDNLMGNTGKCPAYPG